MCRFTPTDSGLERARMAAGLTLAEVAGVVTRDPATVRRWETGKTNPPRSAMLALARAYQVPVATLVD